MKVTLDLPDELAADLRALEQRSASIVAAGLREIRAADGARFHGLAQVLEKLAELPTPEDVLALRPSAELDDRIRTLLEKGREKGLTADEESEWQGYEMVEHLVRVAKGRAKALTQAGR